MKRLLFAALLCLPTRSDRMPKSLSLALMRESEAPTKADYELGLISLIRLLVLSLILALLCSPAVADSAVPEGPIWDLFGAFIVYQNAEACEAKGYWSSDDLADLNNWLKAWVATHDAEVPRSSRDSLWEMASSNRITPVIDAPNCTRLLRESAHQHLHVPFRSLQSPF